MKNLYYLLLIICVAFMVLACKRGGAKSEESIDTTEGIHKGQASVQDDVSYGNALQVARSLDDFSTLVTAIEAAGVEDAIVNVGPLTIFAPINDAFNKLPAGTVETLLKPENKSKLAFILTNHVAPANYPDNQLVREAEKGRKLYIWHRVNTLR